MDRQLPVSVGSSLDSEQAVDACNGLYCTKETDPRAKNKEQRAEGKCKSRIYNGTIGGQGRTHTRTPPTGRINMTSQPKAERRGKQERKGH